MNMNMIMPGGRDLEIVYDCLLKAICLSMENEQISKPENIWRRISATFAGFTLMQHSPDKLTPTTMSRLMSANCKEKFYCPLIDIYEKMMHFGNLHKNLS